MSIASYLETLHGFRSIGRTQLEKISRQISAVSFVPGEYLMRKGDRGECMYIITEGLVRIPLSVHPEDEPIVARLGAGELVGEMALLTGEPRNADVIAESNVAALRIKRQTLEPLLHQYPPLANFLTEILGYRLRQGHHIRFVGKYQIMREIGVGGTSRVYEAVHPGLERVVAIKMLSHTLVYDKVFRERFLDEAKVIAALTHPNIVQVFDTESGFGTYFIVMEKLSGTDLQMHLARRGPLSNTELRTILLQVGSALAYAHVQGVVHRDVKPANCSLDDQGCVKLMDFGIAARIQRTRLGEAGDLVDGTPDYISPEGAVGAPLDGRADMYSLGVTAFELATGRLPFIGSSAEAVMDQHIEAKPPDVLSLRPDLDPVIADFIKQALAKKPDDRPARWDRFLHALQNGNDRNTLEETLIRLRYPPSSEEWVKRAIDLLHTTLDSRGVTIERGRFG